jgi:hypothetical protein
MGITFEREALYAEISTSPISALAKKYGMSDVGLRKVCIALDISLPGRGHWAKIAAGKPSPMPPLRPTKGRTGYHCNPVEAPLTPVPAPAEWLDASLSFERDSANLITVGPVLEAPVPLVKEAKKIAEQYAAQLEKSHAEKRARETSRGEWVMPRFTRPSWSEYSRRGFMELSSQILPMRISAQTLNRALRIWDALLKAAKVRGLSASIEEARLQLSGHGERVVLRMTERIERVIGSTKGLSAGEILMDAHISMVPTGELRVFIGEKKFTDGPGGSLDDQLNNIFSFVFKSLNREGIRRLEAIEQRRVDEERGARLAARVEEAKQRAKLAAEEREREAGLEAEAAAWRRAQEIRAYAAAVSAATPLPAPAHICGWIDWANSVASRIDPLPGRVAVVGAAAPAVVATPRTKEAES